MKLDNYITKEWTNSKLIYKTDFEEFLSIPNVRTVIQLIDILKKENFENSITCLQKWNFSIELIWKSKKMFYFKIEYNDKIRFLKDGEFRFHASWYDEVIWMDEVKQKIQNLSDVSVINYKLWYRNNNNRRIITMSDMLINPNIISLGQWLQKIWVWDSIYNWFDMWKDIEERLQWIECDQFDKDKLLQNIANIITYLLDHFCDINTDNILIDQQSWHLYLLDFIKK